MFLTHIHREDELFYKDQDLLVQLMAVLCFGMYVVVVVMVCMNTVRFSAALQGFGCSVWCMPVFVLGNL